MKEQFALRVKRGSELGRALEALEKKPLTDTQIKKVGGKARTHWLVRQLPKWFDNISIKNVHGDRNKPIELHYTNVIPLQVDVIGDLNIQDAEIVAKESKDEDDGYALVWPSAPPLIKKMKNFDQPRWYNDMLVAVENGRHISLEGPPGVGKDTVVQQLAAKQKKVLVTIGGDAGFRRRDLVGSEKITNGTSRMMVGEYAAAAVNGWWVLLTEVNAADPDALMFINAQLAPPYIVNIQGKSYPVHKDFRIFVSYNHGLIGTKPLPQSFKDRFYPIKVPFFTWAGLERRLRSMGMRSLSSLEMQNSIVVSYGLAMWKAHLEGKMRYQITTRRLADTLMLINSGVDVKDALKKAVIAAIDSPVESRAAENVLRRTLGGI